MKYLLPILLLIGCSVDERCKECYIYERLINDDKLCRERMTEPFMACGDELTAIENNAIIHMRAYSHLVYLIEGYECE